MYKNKESSNMYILILKSQLIYYNPWNRRTDIGQYHNLYHYLAARIRKPNGLYVAHGP